MYLKGTEIPRESTDFNFCLIQNTMMYTHKFIINCSEYAQY
jgi:hypothetical protein